METILGCSKGLDAEFVHPVLNVPLCGWCHKSFTDKELFASSQNRTGLESEDSACLWCGSDDDRQLFMCDTSQCRNCVCTPCVIRNFGHIEAERVKASELWYCYKCNPTAKFSALQIPEDQLLFSVDRCFEAIHSPSKLNSRVVEIAGSLHENELLLLSLFTDEIHTVSVLTDSNRSVVDASWVGCRSSIYWRISAISSSDFRLLDYLNAADCMSSLSLVSRGIRAYIMASTQFLPGLFRTGFGLEHGLSLYPHQHASLRRMREVELRSQEFDSLRGGIFADVPGLGKTITALALICSTSAMQPTIPQSRTMSLSREELNDCWRRELTNPTVGSAVTALLNNVLKEAQGDPATERRFLDIKRAFDLVQKGSHDESKTGFNFNTIEDFEKSGKMQLALLFNCAALCYRCVFVSRLFLVRRIEINGVMVS